MLLTVDPDGTERVLVDPMALDPTGTTTLDAWQPSKEGHLLAYQLSAGGTEESVLRVMDVATGEPVDGPIDRARYSPVAWLPGGEAFYYVRRLAPDAGARRARSSTTAGSGCTGSAPTRTTTSLVFGDGLDKTNYYGVTVSMDGRWLVIGASAGTAPRNDLWLADLSPRPPGRARRCGSCRRASTPARRCTSGGTGGSTSSPTGTRRAAGSCVTDPGRPGVRALDRPGARGRRGRARGLRDPRRRRARRTPVLLCAWTRHAVSEVTVHDLRTGARTGTGAAARPRLGQRASRAARGRARGVVRLHRPRDAVVGLPLRRAHRRDVAVGDRAGDGRGAGGARRARSSTPRPTAPTVRMFVLSPTKEPDQPRPDRPLRLRRLRRPADPGLLRRRCSPGSRPAASTRSPTCAAAPRRARSGTAPGCASTSRTSSTTSTPPPSGWSPTAGRRADQLAISGGSNGGLLVGAALTQRPDLFAAVVCSAPLLDMVRYEQFGLGATWNDEYGSADDAEELGLAAVATRRTTTCARASTTRRSLFTVFDGDTRVDPLHARKMCAALQHATAGDTAGPAAPRE